MTSASLIKQKEVRLLVVLLITALFGASKALEGFIIIIFGVNFRGSYKRVHLPSAGKPGIFVSQRGIFRLSVENTL